MVAGQPTELASAPTLAAPWTCLPNTRRRNTQAFSLAGHLQAPIPSYARRTARSAHPEARSIGRPRRAERRVGARLFGAYHIVGSPALVVIRTTTTGAACMIMHALLNRERAHMPLLVCVLNRGGVFQRTACNPLSGAEGLADQGRQRTRAHRVQS